MENKRAKELIDRYLSGNCSKNEKAIVETWFNDLASKNDRKKVGDFDSMNKEILSRLPEGSIIIERKVKLWPKIAAAASIIFILGIGGYYYQQNRIAESNVLEIAANDVLPAGNKAFLTLADGRKISLTDAGNGQLAEQLGVKIIKTADGQLKYTAFNLNTDELHVVANTKNTNYNLIETPNGGKYQVILPDGTKVWLNAASSLKYPSTFSSAKKRIVELTGEAYFEVSKINIKDVNGSALKRMPFIVKTATQEVEVLGTHFNINSYANEPIIKTTLLEGSVMVRNLNSEDKVLLRPKQESMLSAGFLKVKEADVETAIAWKNNLFLFYHVDLKTIMRQLERWYDINVDMNAMPDREFYGEIPRDVKLSEVLTMLEQTSKLRFKIEGRRIMLQH